MPLQSTKSFFKRFDNLPPNRGNRYFVGPGTAELYVAGQRLNPNDKNSGFSPLDPLATLDQALANVKTGRDDLICFIARGTYTLTANQDVSKTDLTVMGLPGLVAADVTVEGISGGAPLTLSGRGVRLRNFSISTKDAGAQRGDLIIKGDYFELDNMDFGWDGTTRPVFGLMLKPEATGGSASLGKVKKCRFADLDKAVVLAFTAGDFPGATNVVFEECRFENAVTKYIDQEAEAYNNALQFLRNYWGAKPSGVYIDIDNTSTGADVPNVFMGNYFANAAFTDADDIDYIAANTWFIGNYDKAGLITAI